MLTEIRLKNFKCFKEKTQIPISNINLFTGINGRGKSTVLQALLLMRQSPEHSRTTNQIIFNGSCIEIGNFDDVRNSSVSRNEAIELIFRFQRNTDYIDLHYFLQKNDEDDMVADIEKLIGNGKINNKKSSFDVKKENTSYETHYSDGICSTNWYNLLAAGMVEEGEPFEFIQDTVNFTKTHYVSADRIGPQDFYRKQSFTEFPNVGSKGEYAANLLSKKKDDLVHEKLRLEEAETNIVLHQTEAWLSTIFDGGKIDISSLEANIVIVKMNTEKTSNLYKPVNVGFGYSYALPIIVSGLIAQAGEILIVENPEAHLHPFAQSQITKFLARVSACGVQVFIESHRDHVLNGLRIAVLDNIIEPARLNILYFLREENIQIIQIPVGDDGSIENWPDGFFDQTTRDFERLFGV